MKQRRRITKMQRDFADEYIKTRSKYKAMIKAGYSESYARGPGAMTILKIPQVADYIEQQTRKMDARKVATQEEILYGLTKVFRREETEDVVTTDKFGKVTVTQTRNSVKDSMAAGKELLKIVGMTTSNKLEIARLQNEIMKNKVMERQLEEGVNADVTINIVPYKDEEDDD